MKERPIVFSAEMVRAIIEGRKTMTRRLVKGETCQAMSWYARCPYGKPGDRLWVKEAWMPNTVLPLEHRPQGDVIYRASQKRSHDGQDTYSGAWKSPRFMPRWASRILLEIVSERVERVQDISRGDAGLEGMCFLSDINWNKVHNGLNVIQKHHWPEENFARYWNTIHAKKPESQWDANPWVWVVEFKVVTA